MTSRLTMALIIAASLCFGGVTLYLRGRIDADRLDQSRLAAAASAAKTANLEIEGARASAAQVAVSVRTRESAAESVSQLIVELQNLENANAPLDTRRAERLRSHDLRLCHLAPSIAGCATNSDAP